MAKKTWSLQEVKALGTTTSVVIAGEILGLGRTKSYELARQGKFPVPVFDVGQRRRVSVQAILARLDPSSPPTNHHAPTS